MSRMRRSPRVRNGVTPAGVADVNQIARPFAMSGKGRVLIYTGPDDNSW
jgi:hypothetical protein